MTVGENIRRIRKEKGLTQKKLGELCKMNESQIRQYELGKANPKIETIDRIASAMNVKIIDIMEHYTMAQFKNTSEHKKLEREAQAIEGIVSFLADIYGKAIYKEVSGRYFTAIYYVVGEGDNQFILYDNDIDALYKSTKASFPALVDRLKDSRPEDEIVNELIKDCSNEEAWAQVPEKYKH